MNLFEKEKKEAEEALRRRLALETEAALVQQERDLAALIGRLEVCLPFTCISFIVLLKMVHVKSFDKIGYWKKCLS